MGKGGERLCWRLCVTTWHEYRKTSCTKGRQNGSIQDSVSRISNTNQISNIQEIFFTWHVHVELLLACNFYIIESLQTKRNPRFFFPQTFQPSASCLWSCLLNVLTTFHQLSKNIYRMDLLRPKSCKIVWIIFIYLCGKWTVGLK